MFFVFLILLFAEYFFHPVLSLSSLLSIHHGILSIPLVSNVISSVILVCLQMPYLNPFMDVHYKHHQCFPDLGIWVTHRCSCLSIFLPLKALMSTYFSISTRSASQMCAWVFPLPVLTDLDTPELCEYI